MIYQIINYICWTLIGASNGVFWSSLVWRKRFLAESKARRALIAKAQEDIDAMEHCAELRFIEIRRQLRLPREVS